MPRLPDLLNLGTSERWSIAISNPTGASAIKTSRHQSGFHISGGCAGGVNQRVPTG